ncbi:hypothetical protein [Pseudomonas entomophila]|uniref:hypothetical protein n=1 Tax=Pseudomonas entomophila TaxID=312306 RepID=UPI003EB6EC9B
MAFIIQVESFRMNRYIPLTGLDSNFPALLIDAQAPIHVLHDAAVYRIRTVTEALESLVCHEGMSEDVYLIDSWVKLLATQLRDGCALLDVVNRKLNSES